MAVGLLGLWAFTNLELAYALLRVEERARDVRRSLADQRRADRRADGAAGRRRATRARAATCSATTGPRRSCCSGSGGLSATAFVPPADAAPLAPLLRFGAADRARPRRRSSRSTSSTAPTCCTLERPAAAGLYSLAVKLATVVIVAVRAFQYAWPPLAYSVTDDDAGRARSTRASRPTTSLVTGIVVAGLDAARPLGRAAARRARRSRRARGAAVGRARLGALRAVPGAGRDGRARAGHDPQLPGALAGLVVNVVAAGAARAARWGSRAPASRCAAPTS